MTVPNRRLQVVKYDHTGEARGLARRGTVVTSVEIGDGRRVAVSSPRSQVYYISKDDLATYELGNKLTSIDQIKALAGKDHATRNSWSYKENAIAINVNGSWYISHHYRYDRDDTFIVKYGSSETGWLRVPNHFEYQFYEVTLIQDSTNNSNNAGATMNIESPNKDKYFRGSKPAAFNDATLLSEIINLNNVLQAIEAKVLDKESVVTLSSYTAADIESGMALLQSEVEFRSNREALEELARVERELEDLKSREEKQAEAKAKREALVARLGNLVPNN